MINNNSHHEQFPDHIRQSAATFPYPQTPDIAGQVSRRLAAPKHSNYTRLAWAAAVLLIALALIGAVPPVRAAVFQIIHAGAIWLQLDEFQPMDGQVSPPFPDISTLDPIDQIILARAQRVSLDEAQEQVPFTLVLPPELGQPDAVYWQKVDGSGGDDAAVIMVWQDPADPTEIQTLLFQISGAYYGIKQASMESVTSIRIHGEEAFWIEGGHILNLNAGQKEIPTLVSRDVLFWSANDVTYRLESHLTFAKALQMAESLEPIGESNP